MAIKTNSQNEIRHLIKKLDELDNYLESKKTVCDIIGLSMQKVIHTLTEGYESEDEKNGSGTQAQAGPPMKQTSLFLMA